MKRDLPGGEGKGVPGRRGTVSKHLICPLSYNRLPGRLWTGLWSIQCKAVSPWASSNVQELPWNIFRGDYPLFSIYECIHMKHSNSRNIREKNVSCPFCPSLPMHISPHPALPVLVSNAGHVLPDLLKCIYIGICIVGL